MYGLKPVPFTGSSFFTGSSLQQPVKPWPFKTGLYQMQKCSDMRVLVTKASGWWLGVLRCDYIYTKAHAWSVGFR
jgi:hypothetical protein